jgi:glycine dehydrogenase subunit 2
VLNANYIRARLKGTFHLPYDAPLPLHEVVFSDKNQTPHDVHTSRYRQAIDGLWLPPDDLLPAIVAGLR